MAERGLQLWVKDPTKGIGTVRNALGQFQSRDARAITEKFERLAEEAQANVVAHIEESITRRSVSTGRLAKVTAAPENRYADQFGFGVGVVKYLDNSIAKYWRSFEEGSAKAWSDTPGGRSSMVGMQLRGKFGGSITGWKDTRTPGPQPQPLAGKPWGAQGGKLRWYWNMPENPNFTVKHDYPGRHAYLRTYQEGGIFTDKPQRIIADFLRQQAARALQPQHPNF